LFFPLTFFYPANSLNGNAALWLHNGTRFSRAAEGGVG